MAMELNENSENLHLLWKVLGYHLVLAVFVYGEPFRTSQAITFGCIWCALFVFSYDAVAMQRRARLARKLSQA